MKRAAFLRRMAFAALACGFLDVRMPEIESEWADDDGTEWYVVSYGPIPPYRPGRVSLRGLEP